MATTAAIATGNILFKVYHTNYNWSLTPSQMVPLGQPAGGGADFGLITPDATATLPLSSFPLANAADDNRTVAGTPAYVEGTFDNPVTFTSNVPVGFFTIQCDLGFTPVNNIVVFGFHPGTDLSTSNSLNFPDRAGMRWFQVATSPNVGVEATTVELNFNQGAQSRSFGTIVG